MPVTQATRECEAALTWINADKRSPTSLVYISDTNLHTSGHAKLIRRIRIELNADAANFGEIEFRSVGPSFIDDPLFLEGRFVEVYIGYMTSHVEFQTRFINRVPKIRYTDPKTLTISGLSEEVLLMRTKRRRIFKGATYAEIAKYIATSYYNYSGSGLSIDATETVLPSVSQVNESDYEFLQRIARRCGRELVITGEQFSFIQPKERINALPIDLQDNEVAEVDITVLGEGKAVALSSTATDPLTGNIIWGISNRVVDGVVDREDGEGFLTVDDLASVRTKFVDSFSSFPTQAEVNRIVDDATNRSKYIVTAHVRMAGRSGLKPNQYVFVTGIGRYEGPFLTKKVIHEVVGNVYTTELIAVRGWSYPTSTATTIGDAQTTGGQADEGKTDVTSSSPQSPDTISF
jgi:phage protein D